MVSWTLSHLDHYKYHLLLIDPSDIRNFTLQTGGVFQACKLTIKIDAFIRTVRYFCVCEAPSCLGTVYSKSHSDICSNIISKTLQYFLMHILVI